MTPFITDLKWSLRFVAIAIIPIGICAFLLTELLGGIEGAGKLILLATLWPMVILEPFTKGSDGSLVWMVFFVCEFSYCYLIVFVVRIMWSTFRLKR